jgi:serine/threonine protein phosphatase PrpC
VLRIVEEAARTDTGRQRHANEDSYYVRSPMYVVADGMGGAQAGEVASRIAADVFDEELGEGNPEKELERLAREANRRIFELARADASRTGMGTTLTGALISNNEVTIVHVGDSRAYLYREGELRQLTRDHSLVEELRRKGQLTTEEAEEHPQRSVITRALGPEPDVEPDVHTHQARSGDVFLLCSDGLTSMIREERVGEILATSGSLDTAVNRLVEEANQAGGRDNITVVCFRLGGEEEAGAVDDTITDLHTSDLVAAAEAPVVAAEEDPVRAPVEAPTSKRPVRPRRRRLTFKRVAVTAVVLAVFVGAGFGAVAGSHRIYFLGEDRGLVTVYRGVPYDLPFGIKLYQSRYVSSVPVRALSTTERRRLLDHQLRSKKDAADLVRGLEAGRGY